MIISNDLAQTIGLVNLLVKLHLFGFTIYLHVVPFEKTNVQNSYSHCDNVVIGHDTCLVNI